MSKVEKGFQIKRDLDRSDSICLPNSEIIELCATFFVRVSLTRF